MIKITQLIFTGIILIYTLGTKSALAVSTVTETSDVTATVPSSSLYGPNLISPPNNSSTNNPKTTFIWKGSSSGYLSHYDLFIDDAIFAGNIPNNLTSQDFYFYTASASSSIFYISLKQNQTEGYHTWKVSVYDEFGQNTTTNSWTYYIDSVAPFISLTKVNTTSYSWNTSVSGSIPEESQRYLTVSGSSPKLSGKVETNANFQFSLICPSGAPSTCTNQSWVSNSTDGNWEQQLVSLAPDINYSVILSATDASNNTTIFPTFYLKYKSSSVTATSTPTTTPTETTTPSPTLPSLATPTQLPLPSTSITITPPPNLAAQITPTPFLAKTPPAPTPPPRKQAAVVIEPNYLNLLLIILLCIGLPTHLILSAFSLGIKAKDSLRFVLLYGFPFLRRHNATSRPFSQITLYDTKNPQKAVYVSLSDINGKYFLPNNLPNQILVRVKKVAYNWKDQLLNKNILLSSCLVTYQKRPLTDKELLQNYIYNNIKVIPLAVALITSTVCMYFLRNSYTTAYLYLTLQYIYSEYFYPKKWIKK